VKKSQLCLLYVGKAPEYTPIRDFRPLPEVLTYWASGTDLKSQKGLYSGLPLYIKFTSICGVKSLFKNFLIYVLKVLISTSNKNGVIDILIP
jgi:hypothetical protein